MTVPITVKASILAYIKLSKFSDFQTSELFFSRLERLLYTSVWALGENFSELNGRKIVKIMPQQKFQLTQFEIS